MTLLDFPTTLPTTAVPTRTARRSRQRFTHAGETTTTNLAATNPSASSPAATTFSTIEPSHATRTPPAPQHSAPAGPRRVPDGTQARGFVLYVGLDEATAAAGGTDLAHIVQALKQLTADLAPAAQTHAAVALAPAGAGGRNVDVVRLALQEPVAVAAHRSEASDTETATAALVIDFTRKTVTLDGTLLALTYTELELLEYLIRNEGRAITRTELIGGLRGEAIGPREGNGSHRSSETPNERTIDVHVRRLRAKLGHYGQIVRTVRGAGYRFDQHPDVRVRFSQADRVRSA